MLARIIRHEELDRELDRAARDPGKFEREARRLASRYDSLGVDLEVRDPALWHKALGSVEIARVALPNQLRYEVENIIPLDREEEARLARRIEFARLRLQRATKAAGLEPSDVEGGATFAPSAFLDGRGLDCALPPKVCRRWMELHALRTEMVERNLYLVLINVERYAHTTVGRTDLIQEGAAALFRAVDGFDWRRGLLFRTYAVHWLNQAFRSYLYNFGNTVRVPVYLQKATKHIHQAIERLGDRNASPEQIAEVTGLGRNLVATALTASRAIHSIDAPVGDDDDGVALRDVIEVSDGADPYSTALEDVSLEEGITQAMERLSDRERFVVQKRFGIGEDREYTLAEVARELGVSLERVRQIQVRAIAKMKTPALRKAVDPYLN